MSLQELQSIWDELYPIIPNGIDTRLNEVDEYGDKVSMDVLVLNRQITYLLSVRNKQIHISSKFSVSDLVVSAASDPQEALRTFAPLEVQSLSALINYLLTKPSVLAEAVAKANHQSVDVWSLINITIPTVFSFFSSRECSTFAYNFYLCLSTLMPFNVYIGYVYPFFNTSAVAPFSEAVFHDFFWKNYLSQPPPLVFAQKLLAIARDRIFFLPEAHLGLLRGLSLRATQEQIWLLLITDILLPHLLSEENMTPFIHTSDMKANIEAVVKILIKHVQSKGGELELPSLDLTGSMLEVPDAFLPFGQSFYIDLIMTQLDIRNLVSLGFDLPHHWERLTEMANAQKRDPLCPFRVRVFPRLPKPPSFPQRPLIFRNFGEHKMPHCGVIAQLWSEVENIAEARRVTPFEILLRKPIRNGNRMLDLKMEATDIGELVRFGLEYGVAIMTETAKLFEKLMQHRMELFNLSKWQRMARDFVTRISYETAKSISDKFCKRRPEKLLNRIWQTIERLEGPPQVKYWSVMMILDRVEPVVLRSHLKEIHALEQRFSALRDYKENHIDEGPDFASKAMKQCMWEASALLSFPNTHSCLFTRHMILATYLAEIEKLIVAAGWEDSRQDFEKIVHFSLSAIECTWTLRTVIFLQATLFTDERLLAFVSPRHADIWKKFTVAFIQFLSGDISLLTEYGQLSSGAIRLPQTCL